MAKKDSWVKIYSGTKKKTPAVKKKVLSVVQQNRQKNKKYIEKLKKENKMPNLGGRPKVIETPEELQALVDEYFAKECMPEPVKYKDDNGNIRHMYDKDGMPVMRDNPPTVAGLALYLGFCDRVSMFDYKKNTEFSNVIKGAITKIETFAEKNLYGKSSTGAIFWLKNRHNHANWQDKTEVDGETKVVVQMPMVEIGGQPVKFNVGREKK